MGAPMRFLSAGATPKSGAGEEGEKIHVEVAVDVEGNLKDALADSGCDIPPLCMSAMPAGKQATCIDT